jgi:hypothetical protein
MKKEFLQKIAEEFKKANNDADQNKSGSENPNELVILNSNETGLAQGGNCPVLNEGGCNPYGQCTTDCFINIGSKKIKTKKS